MQKKGSMSVSAPHEELKFVFNIIQVFLKAKKMLRMYPRNNPVYIKTLDDAFGQFTEYFRYLDSLQLKFGRNDIFYNGESVYNSQERQDNLALMFFKDGLRELTFKRDITKDELEEFLRILSLDYDREAIEDDISTQLWEKNFLHIEYLVDDTYLAESEEFETNAVDEAKKTEEASSDPQVIYDNILQDNGAGELSIIPLTQTDYDALRDKIAADDGDKTGKFFNILLEILRGAERQKEYEEVVLFFMKTMEFSIRQMNLMAVTDMMAALKQIIADRTAPESLRKSAIKILLFASSYKIIALLKDILDDARKTERKEFQIFFSMLDKNAVAPLIKLLSELETIHGRKMAISALVFLGPKDMATLIRTLHHPKWYVARNIVYILREIGDKSTLRDVLMVLRHEDGRVTREVIRTIGALGDDTSLETLKQCLRDDDSGVRNAALKAAGAIGSEKAKRMLMQEMNTKDFRERPIHEKREFFEVIAQWGDADVQQFLEKTLMRRTFWKKARNFELRACAAHGLGLMGKTSALPLLEKCRANGNSLLKEYAGNATKRIKHGQ